MKNIAFYLLIIFLAISCVNQKGNRSTKSLDSSASKNEDFAVFFNTFKSDSLFQLLRIDDPLIIETIKQDHSENVAFDKKFEKIKAVSFDSAVWGKGTYINIKSKSLDTIIVELKVKGTGIFIQHYFVSRNNPWFLYEIKDLSD
jgi:hypothetical protein